MSHGAAIEPANGEGAAIEPASRWRALRDRCLDGFDPTKRRALAALLVRVLGAAIAYLMQILLAQWLGLAEYGVFVGVWVWLLVLGGIAPLGLNVSSIGLLATYHGAGDFARWRGLLVTGVVASLIAGLVVAGGGWTILYGMPGLLAEPYLMPVWLCLFCVPLLALSDFFEGISRAHGWMNTALAPTYLLRPLLLIGGVFVATQFGAALDAALAMAMAIFACLITMLVQGAIILVRLRGIGGTGPCSATPFTWLLMALPIVVTQTFELLTQNFDMIAVSYFLGPEATGVYFAALKTIALLAFINFAIGAATANRVASLHAAGENEALKDALDGAVNLAFWPTLLGALAIVVLAPVLLSLFGADFAAHAYLTAVLAVGFVAKGFVGPAELYLNVLGQQRICALTLVGAAVLNMALNVVLIPIFGLLGAAIATSVSFVALAIALFVIVRRRIGVVLRPTLPRTSLRKVASGAKA